MDTNLLRQFVPLGALSQSTLDVLASQTEEINQPKGQVIFRQGDDDPWLYFLLEGEVLCQEPHSAPRTIQSGSEQARHALSRSHPRDCSVVAASSVRLLRLDEHLLESCLGSDQAAAYEIFEYDGCEDPAWMMHILSKPTFRKVPPAHANAMFARFELLHGKAGDVIIQQGEHADYYYLIRSGHAQVSRTTSDGTSVALAELGPGDGFGEEALLTGELRNASVTLRTECVLMRLSKQDFDSLLKTPLVKSIDLEGARHLIQGGAQLVDVRLEEEFQAGTLRGSLNLPLYLLRLKAESLDPQTKYILFCQHDQRSSAAAFLLAQRGLDTYVLSGGLAALKPHEVGVSENEACDAHAA